MKQEDEWKSDLSAEVKGFLTANGWSPTRCVDSSDVFRMCDQRHYRLFDSYCALVESVRGICVDLTDTPQGNGPCEKVWFNPMVCFCDSLRFARRELGRNVLPLAEVDNIGLLMLGDDGSYWLDMLDVRRVGMTFDEAIGRILIRRDWPA